jgi:hypothetical protein
MKLTIVLTAVVCFVGLMFGSQTSTANRATSISTTAGAQVERKMPEAIQLATESKLGSVTFNHANHVTKNYNVAGTAPIACTECHHTAQPIGCRSCHARTGEKPKVWPEIPQIKYEGGTAMITLNNQQAFHRNCGGCHDAAAKERPTIKAPKTSQCTLCHKK